MAPEEQTSPLVCQQILGDEGDAAFANRCVDAVTVAAADASKRRLRLSSKSGLDVVVDLPRGSFLRDGAVLADDGERVVVVSRTPEEIMRVTISGQLDGEARVSAALRVGHAFGSQHVPVEVRDGELLVPITTSREVATRTLETLGLDGVEAQFEIRPLARLRPLSGHAHPHVH